MQEFHHDTMTTETGSDSVFLLSLIIHTIITCTCTQTHRQITHVASHASQSQATQERSYVTLYQLKLQFKILLPSVYV